MATHLRVFRSFQSHLMNFFISECKDKTLFYISYCSLIFFYLFFYFFCYSLSQSLHVYEYQYIVYFIRQTIGFILTPDFTLNRHNPFLPFSNKLILLRNQIKKHESITSICLYMLLKNSMISPECTKRNN